MGWHHIGQCMFVYLSKKSKKEEKIETHDMCNNCYYVVALEDRNFKHNDI